jgi:hypothetical protein
MHACICTCPHIHTQRSFHTHINTCKQAKNITGIWRKCAHKDSWNASKRVRGLLQQRYVCICVCMLCVGLCVCVFVLFVCACVYVFIYACMHACMYVCIYVCRHTHKEKFEERQGIAATKVCMHVCVCMYVCIYIHTHRFEKGPDACLCMCMHIHMCMHMHRQTHTHTHTHTHIYSNTYTCIQTAVDNLIAQPP